MYFYRARYYSPTFQRFVSQDPIGFRRGSANLHAYVENTSVNLSDPFGLWTFQIGLGGSATGGDGAIGGGGTGSFGLIIDGQGNVGFYGTVGGSIGTGAGGGLSLSAGINLQWSNGGCIKDFRGLFFETIGSVGGVSGDASGGRIAKSAGCRWWRCVWSRRRVQADMVRPRRQALFHWEIYLMCSKDSVGRERLGAIRMFELILLLIFSSQR